MPKPRLVTKTVGRLLTVANKLDALAREVGILADELIDTDARETRPDPRLRKKRSVKR